MKHISFFEQAILNFYREHGRKHLPWRTDDMNSYKVWVSEIMLQQTQVDRVIGFYTRFLDRFPDVFSLARASWEEFLPYYQGLGYYNRGRNMLRTAQEVAQSGGKFPRDIDELQKLPGIGLYTAQAILSFAHADDHLAWDTNFARVFGRFFYGSKDAVIEKTIFEGSIRANKKDFNGAIMDFGSLVCIKRPRCGDCPLSFRCRYFADGGTLERSEISEKKVFSTSDAQVIVVLHEGGKKFFSSEEKTYVPFLLPALQNSRQEIQRFFLEKYDVTLSVRPPYKKTLIGGKPFLFVRAQILLGEYAFASFSKQEAEDELNEIIKGEGKRFLEK